MSYKRRMEKDVVARLISWPIILCLWLLLGALVVAAFFAWYVQVPTYVDGSGIILARGDMLKPDTTLPATMYAGSLLTARVETGSRRLFSLLAGLGQSQGSNS